MRATESAVGSPTGRIRSAVGVGLALVALATSGCAAYSGRADASGAVEDTTGIARSVEVQIVNTSDQVVFNEVGFSIEQGEWVAPPIEGALLSPGHRTHVMAQSVAPGESVSGYVTFVGGVGADLTVQFRHESNGPSVRVEGSLSGTTTVTEVRNRDGSAVSYLLAVDDH